MLQSLGIAGETEAVYRALLRRPGVTVDALAVELGVSEADLRKALDALADLALISQSWRESGAVLPVSPEFGFEALLAKQQAELARRQQEIEATRAAAAALVADYVCEYSTGHGYAVERLDGVESVRLRIQELASRTERETLAFAPGGPQTEANRQASRPLTESLLARAVSVRTVYLDSVRNDAASIEHALWLAERGGETRTVPSLPLRLQIFDRRSALVPVDPDDSSRGALLIHEPGAVVALCALFDLVWKSAEPVGFAAARCTDPFSPQERELLRLLSEGVTDEAAARRLGVSLRTERRMITELSDRLGAKSRFQLGQRAAEEGLLS
ncbi:MULTISPECIES: helix-turn-helix transcriptional regulator [unclassified Streptomyces]|uniref:helix-turn-helix transcriptional regulator n=1 Tax=unclassified Streptomyces TaxID=2593676 RepID=UPI003807EA38